MPLRPQRLALPCQLYLIAEIPITPNTIPPAACLCQVQRPLVLDAAHLRTKV